VPFTLDVLINVGQ